MAVGGENSKPGAGRAFLTYNVLRLGLLALCLGIGWLAGIHDIWLIVGSLFISGVLSWFVLRRQREAMGVAVEQTVERSRVHFAVKTAAEDAYADSVHGTTAPLASPPSAGVSARSSGDQTPS